MQVNSCLQTFCAMRRSASIIIIGSFFSCNLNELREAYHHQLSRRVEKNALFDKSSSLSKQLMIKSFIEKSLKKIERLIT